MEWKVKRELFAWTIILLMVLLSLYFYPRLPEIIPSHFGVQGQPNQYAPKGQLMALILGLTAGLYLLLTFIPLIDPFWRKIQKRYSLFLIFRDLMLCFFLFLYVLSLLAAQQGSLPLNAMGIGFGLFFALLGNYLPKLPRNWFFGIRNPWTISSDIVWRKTHILGGWLFVLSGLVLIIFSLLGFSLLTGFIVTLLPTFVVSGIVYPFYLFKKLQREGQVPTPEL